MKRDTIATVMTVALALLWGSVLAQPKTLPMPPTFSVDADRMEVLKRYPLGVITEQAAFVRHGKPDRVIKLPDGREGWVYEVRSPGQAKTYTLPSGHQQTVIERGGAGSEVRTYTLVFDDKGVVVDVLSNEPGSHGGHSAAALQLNPRTAPQGTAVSH